MDRTGVRNCAGVAVAPALTPPPPHSYTLSPSLTPALTTQSLTHSPSISLSVFLSLTHWHSFSLSFSLSLARSCFSVFLPPSPTLPSLTPSSHSWLFSLLRDPPPHYHPFFSFFFPSLLPHSSSSRPPPPVLLLSFRCTDPSLAAFGACACAPLVLRAHRQTQRRQRDSENERQWQVCDTPFSVTGMCEPLIPFPTHARVQMV